MILAENRSHFSGSLCSFEHDLIRKPVSIFRHHALKNPPAGKSGGVAPLPDFVHVRPKAGQSKGAPARWAGADGHAPERHMTGQRAREGEIRTEAGAHEPRLGDQAPLKLEHFLPYQLNVVSSLVSQALSRVYSRRYGIGVPEWRVLVTLGQHGVMTAKAIGAHTHMH